jgi:SAM-dependent methyltransferase
MDMRRELQQETEALRKSWMWRRPHVLRDYLVQDVEDPRINVQSILTRHFLIDSICAHRFSHEMEMELRFAVVGNWLLRLLKHGMAWRRFLALRRALLAGRTHSSPLDVPRCVSEAFLDSNWREHICGLLDLAEADVAAACLPPQALDSLGGVWRRLLGGLRPTGLSVLEPACGSANDYRFLHRFGIAGLIDYVGFDLCEKNIANAAAMFPQTRFEVGNVLRIDAPTKAFDYCIVHDLFEHLSPAALGAGIAEICRVTRRGICVGFFNMSDASEHVVRKIYDYHRNRLSAALVQAAFRRHGCDVEMIPIHSFLQRRFGFGDTHNRHAYTFFVRFQAVNGDGGPDSPARATC